MGLRVRFYLRYRPSGLIASQVYREFGAIPSAHELANLLAKSAMWFFEWSLSLSEIKTRAALRTFRADLPGGYQYGGFRAVRVLLLPFLSA